MIMFISCLLQQGRQRFFKSAHVSMEHPVKAFPSPCCLNTLVAQAKSFSQVMVTFWQKDKQFKVKDVTQF